jgi:hypothetical protein
MSIKKGETEMNTTYKVIFECKENGKSPRMSPYNISKGQFDRMMAIAHENTPKMVKGGYK